jgi:hypothetical protein
VAEVSSYRNIQTSVVVCPSNWPCFSVVIYTHCKALMESLRSGPIMCGLECTNATFVLVYFTCSCRGDVCIHLHA